MEANKMSNHTANTVTVVTPSFIHKFVSKGAARLECNPQQDYGDFDGIPIVGPPQYTAVSGLPGTPNPNGILVCNAVGEYLASHRDLYQGPVFSPDTSADGCVRGRNGNCVYYKRLIRHQ